jgi:hypothetical protein
MTVQYVGMDVDKQKIVLARLGAGRDTSAIEKVIANTPSAVKKYFTPLLGGGEVHARRRRFSSIRRILALNNRWSAHRPTRAPRGRQAADVELPRFSGQVQACVLGNAQVSLFELDRTVVADR